MTEKSRACGTLGQGVRGRNTENYCPLERSVVLVMGSDKPGEYNDLVYIFKKFIWVASWRTFWEGLE